MTHAPLSRRAALGAPILFLATRARAEAPHAAVASFSVLGDLVRQVAGDRFALRILVGPDQDAHEFEPRPADAAALRGAALVFRNGLGFEPWMDRLLAAGGRGGRIVTASDGVTPLTVTPGTPDPHAWQAVGNARRYVANIAAALQAADPDGAAAYRERAAACDARLAALDGWVRDQVGTVPRNRRVVVTTHRAFGYLGAAYGIEFRAAEGISTEAAPTASQVAALIRQIRADHITAVFGENLRNPVLLDRLAAEAGVRVRGALYSDALSPPDGPAPDYEAMMRHNVGLLVPAMRGG